MVTISNVKNLEVEIAIITLNSKAYYEIVKILKTHGFCFCSLTPTDKIPKSINLVITTNAEKHIVSGINHITIEELHNTLTQRCVLISKLSDVKLDIITIGIDPGYRSGLTVYSYNKQLYSKVCRSTSEIKKIVLEICKYFMYSKKIIKIGIGDKHNSFRLADSIKKFNDKNTSIEIVNEFGTSQQKRKPNKRGFKDIRAAEIIAFRQGKSY